MMNLYRPNDSRTTRGRRRLIAATAVVIIVCALDIVTHGLVRSNVRVVAAPIQRVAGDLWIGISQNGYFLTRRALEAQLAAQREQIAQMEEDEARYSQLKEENDQLRALVHVASGSPGITAPVISSLQTSPYGTFLIGAGTVDGVEKGNLIIDSGGFVIGRISDVGATTALVTELFAPGSSIDALIDGSPVIAEGRGGGNASAKVPHGVQVAEGDPVTAPSLSGRSIGVVGSVQAETTGAYSDIYIGLPVNLLSLQYVYVQK